MSDSPRQPWANKPLHLRARGGTAWNEVNAVEAGPGHPQPSR